MYFDQRFLPKPLPELLCRDEVKSFKHSGIVVSAARSPRTDSRKNNWRPCASSWSQSKRTGFAYMNYVDLSARLVNTIT